MSEPLDRPVWNALTTSQAHLAGVSGAAVRIDADYGPFAAARDMGEEAQAALYATLRGPDDRIGVVERDAHLSGQVGVAVAIHLGLDMHPRHAAFERTGVGVGADDARPADDLQVHRPPQADLDQARAPVPPVIALRLADRAAPAVRAHQVTRPDPLGKAVGRQGGPFTAETGDVVVQPAGLDGRTQFGHQTVVIVQIVQRRQARAEDFVPIEPAPYATFEDIRLDAWLTVARAEVCATLQASPELILPGRLLKSMRAAALAGRAGPLLERHPARQAIANNLRALGVELDDEKNKVVRKHYYNLGMAVATEAGLVVPVVKDVDQRSILDIAADIQRLAGLAREGKLAPDDVRGGTFSITNIGSLGGLFSFPIINLPEAAILGVHSIKKRPVVLEDDSIVARQMLYLSLSFDHRLVDGAEGAMFTSFVIDLLENPEALMLDL